jgi:hypothetical protein
VNDKEIDMRSKKIAAAAMGAALLGGGGLATLMTSSASAAETSTSSSATSATDSAAKPGAWMSTALKKLVDAGTLTQAQSDAVTKALDAARPQGGPGGGGPGHGQGGPGLTVAAKALGVTAADLKTALQSGKTIADVAKTNNVDIDTVIKAIVTAENTHIDEQLAAGNITAAQATERKADATERATNMVNGVRPTPPTNNSSTPTTTG